MQPEEHTVTHTINRYRSFRYELILEGVVVGAPVTLIGSDQGEEITVEELAELCGGFHYEMICDLGKRIPRVYYQNGQVVGTKDYFDDKYEDFLTGKSLS